MHQQTQENLLTAMRGEAFAYLKYLLFAGQARQDGHADLAALFERTAHVEHFEHFMQEAQLYGLVGSDVDNLRNAIEGESYEVETMYRQFAEQAAAAGDQEAAERFSEIHKDELGHRDAFQAALTKMEGSSGS